LKAIIKRIRIYPVKSLDPIEVAEAEIGIRSLKHDRSFALLAEDGRFVNGKRTGRVNELKANYTLEERLIHLSSRSGGSVETFELREDNQLLNQYFSDFFDLKLHILYRTKGELMDIPGSSSVTIVSEASIKSLHTYLSHLSEEDIRLRFRTNIELDGVDAYWEENLFDAPGVGMRFTLGDVEMVGISPRARCNVPPRDPWTGETDTTFVKSMIQSRERSLPANSSLPKYGSLYHLTVNTYIPDTQQGKTLKVGEELKIIEPVNLG